MPRKGQHKRHLDGAQRKVTTEDHGASDRDSHDHSKKDKDEDRGEEDLTVPEFNSQKAVGVKFVIPVTSFFCTLCHMFYNSEEAKRAHCQTEAHYEKFKAVVEEKQAKAKRQAEWAAAEEEDKLNQAEKPAADEDRQDKHAASKVKAPADPYQTGDSRYGYFAGPPDQAPLEDYRLLEPADKTGDSTLKGNTSSQEEASSDQSHMALGKETATTPKSASKGKSGGTAS